MLAACQEREVHFKGSSEHWTANLIVDEVSGSEKKQLEIIYEGNESEAIESFEYLVENRGHEMSFGEKDVYFNEQNTYRNKDLSSNHFSTTREDIFHIIIKWNGESERFEMKSE